MFHLVYVSSAVRPFSHAELEELVALSRINNQKLEVTGMLLYKDGNFMQALEGEEAVVRKLYAKIERDPRHNGVMAILQERTDQRQFPDWFMGFYHLGFPKPAEEPNRDDFRSTPFADPISLSVTGEKPSRARKLLKTFFQQK